MARTLGVAVIGYGWMGRVHAQAYARLAHHYPQLGARPRLVSVADEVPGRAAEAAEQLGFDRSTQRWRDLLTDPEIDAISVTTPNFLHREVGVAVLEAGKHLWIEKPVGLRSADAQAVADAAHRGGLATQVGFNYRNAPAVQAAREMIAAGEIGAVTHARVRLFSDYAAHPDGALTWRYERERGGARPELPRQPRPEEDSHHQKRDGQPHQRRSREGVSADGKTEDQEGRRQPERRQWHGRTQRVRGGFQGFLPDWRRGWDSNPRSVSRRPLSRRLH